MAMNSLIFYLREPFDHIMERAVELFCSKAPEKKDLCERIHYVVTSIIYLIASPLSISLFIFAGVLDSVKQLFSKVTYTNSESKAPIKECESIKVLTWNVCMLFGGLPIPFGGMAPVTKRIIHVAKKIIDTDADLISLQEVSPPAAKRLYDQLKNSYRYFYTRINPDPFLMLDSGLFIASKVPIANPEVVSIPLAARMKRALFTFEANGIKFGTTHLEPGNEPVDQRMRLNQLGKILENKIHVLFGDLNIERGTELKESGLKERFLDSFKDTVTTSDNLSIDYILTQRPETISLIDSEGLSDHHILTSVLEAPELAK